MPSWLVLAEGPAFYFVLTMLVLGLLRLVVITVWDIAAAIRSAGDKRIPFSTIARQTLSWLMPVGRLHQARLLYSLGSFGLHLGILLAGLFLSSHLDILQVNLGFAWFAIPKWLLDIFTLIGILGAAILLLSRLYVISSRFLSRASDYLMLLLLLNILLSGYVAGQGWNPIPYDGLMLFHTLSGMLLLAVAPFTRVAHCVLFPFIRLASEVAWHFPPQSGERVVRALHGPQGRKI